MKLNLITILLLIISLTSKGDGILSGHQDSKLANQLSPQADDFMKYGNIPVSHFIGETNVRIPIYTYKDKDFEIPVFLGYNSEGFMPNKKEGVVGLNWFLNAGGMITRKVNGWPDEKMGTPSAYPTKLHGLYYGIKNNLSVKTTSKASIIDPNSCGTVTHSEYWNIDGCEVEPDEFSVNAPGCNAHFFFENNGTVRCTENKSYKFDFTNFKTQSTTGTEIDSSEIIIINELGYKYYFGGRIRYLEISYPLDNLGKAVINEPGPTIIGWYLTKIVAPNGRQVTYYYRNFVEGVVDHIVRDNEHYIFNVHDEDFRLREFDSVNFPAIFSRTPFEYYEMSTPEIIYEVTKTAYLEKIKIDNVSIDFSYQQRTNKFYTGFTSAFNQRPMGLTNIYLKYASDTLKSFALSYSYTGGQGGNRYFLTNIAERGKSPYTFLYYKQQQVPDPRTKSIDYWGYFNDNVLDSLIPSVLLYDNGDFVYTNNIREPSADKFDVALLEKIIYPTGGFTSFVYERHTYSSRLERRSTNGFLPSLYPVTGYAGGARIHDITDDDGLGNVKQRIFNYTLSFPDTSTSSGILLDWPRYGYTWKYDDGYKKQKIVKKQSSSFNCNHSSSEKYIQYSEVAEIEYPNNGYTVYKFTDYSTNPDINNYLTRVLDPAFLSHVNNIGLYNNYVGIKMNDCSFQRGFPYSISYFSNSGTILKKKEITLFTSVADFPTNYVASVLLTGAIAQSHKLYYVPFLPKTEVETSYLNGTAVVTTRNYSYNSWNLPSEISENNSMGGLVAKKTKYVADLNTYSPYYNMFNLNILSFPIEETSTMNGNVVGSNLTTYRQEGGTIYVPNQQYSLETTSALTNFTQYNGNTKDSRYSTTPEIYNQNYDNQGNLLKALKKDGMSIYYVWGYGKQYPVAKIESTSNSYDLTFIQQAINSHSFSAAIQAEVNYLKTLLSSYISNPNCMVTLYTYKPLVGKTSETAPNGVTTYYNYDSFGRLSEIRDDDYRLLKRYEYNYAHTNPTTIIEEEE